MEYIVVRTYGNGRYMNKVYPMWFKWLSQAERMCDELNKSDTEDEDKWIVMPVIEYVGRIFSDD